MAARDADMYKVTLKSWLYERIKENYREDNYRGLKWIDEDNLIFQLPWVTENDPHWQEYYKLFHDWARRDGGESTDSQKAKRNFRSALNHSKHFKNLKDRAKDLQTGSYKVYKFLTQDEIAKEKSTKQRNISEDSSGSQMMQSPESQSQMYGQYHNDFSNGVVHAQDIPAQPGYMMQHSPDLHAFGENNLNVLAHPGADVSQLQPMNHLRQECLIQPTIATSDMHMSSMNTYSIDSETALSMARQRLNDIPDLGKCLITIEYNGKNSGIHVVDICQQGGCRILFDPSMPSGQFPNNVYLSDVSQREAPGLHKILENMKRGILLCYNTQRQRIVVRRECLAHAYYFPVQSNEAYEAGNLQTIKRKEDYDIYSFETLFNFMLDDIIHSGTSQPLHPSTVEIIVGVQPKPDQQGKPVKGVKISIKSEAAARIISKDVELYDSEIVKSLCSIEHMECSS